MDDPTMSIRLFLLLAFLFAAMIALAIRFATRSGRPEPRGFEVQPRTWDGSSERGSSDSGQ
jgi:hypothetical protein